jgi:hypothetical protein
LRCQCRPRRHGHPPPSRRSAHLVGVVGKVAGASATTSNATSSSLPLLRGRRPCATWPQPQSWQPLRHRLPARLLCASLRLQGRLRLPARLLWASRRAGTIGSSTRASGGGAGTANGGAGPTGATGTPRACREAAGFRSLSPNYVMSFLGKGFAVVLAVAEDPAYDIVLGAATGAQAPCCSATGAQAPLRSCPWFGDRCAGTLLFGDRCAGTFAILSLARRPARRRHVPRCEAGDADFVSSCLMSQVGRQIHEVDWLKVRGSCAPAVMLN